MIPQPTVTISDSPSDAGEEIQLEGWHASNGRGGNERAGGIVTADVARRVFQGMTMKFWIGGRCVWSGPISNNPLVYRGKASLEASGWMQKAVRSTGRLLYQSRDVSLFTDRNSPPYATGQAQFFQPTAEAGLLKWMIESGQAVNPNDAHGVILWAPGTPGGITRYAWTWLSTFASGIYVIQTWRHTGPAGAFTAAGTHGLATSGTIDHAVSGGEDSLLIELIYTGSATTTGWGAALLTNLVVHGIASATGAFTTSQVVTDILGRLGFDTSGVQSSGVDAMPFDHSSGSWWDALLYQAFLDDWAAPNIVPSDDGRERLGLYHPWGDTVHTISLENAEFDLNALEIVNGVVVQYPHVGGFTAEVTVRPSDIGETDPLAGRDADNFLHVSLQDPQPDAALATVVGQNVLRRTINLRFEGSGEIPELEDAVLWDMLHGHELNVADWGPLEAQRLPIDSVSLAQGRPARVSIYSPGAELGLADRVGLARARVFQNPELPAVEVIRDALEEPGEVFHSHCHKHGPKKTHHKEPKGQGKKAFKHKHQHSHEKIPQTRHKQEKDDTTEPC